MKKALPVMNDVMRSKASFDQVTWALSDLLKKHKNAAFLAGLDFIGFMMDERRQMAFAVEREALCIRLGWSLDVHEAMDHDRIMASIMAEQ